MINHNNTKGLVRDMPTHKLFANKGEGGCIPKRLDSEEYICCCTG